MNRALPPLFDGLEEGPASIVQQLLRNETFSPGQVLFEQGDLGPGAFFICEGDVDIDVRLPGGATSHLTTVGPGHVLGELSLLSEQHRRTATATAATEVHCRVMERRDLLAICAQYHPASPPVLGQLASHVIASIRRVNGERIELARAPRAAMLGEAETIAGASFDIRGHALGLEFTRGFRASEVDALLQAGHVTAISAGNVPSRGAARTWYLVLRGAVSLCEGDEVPRRLSLVGPGRVAASDALVEGGFVLSREGVTVLALPDAQVKAWREGGEHWTHRALQAWVRGLMDQLAEDTRSLARERRQAVAGRVGPQGAANG